MAAATNNNVVPMETDDNNDDDQPDTSNPPISFEHGVPGGPTTPPRLEDSNGDPIEIGNEAARRAHDDAVGDPEVPPEQRPEQFGGGVSRLPLNDGAPSDAQLYGRIAVVYQCVQKPSQKSPYEADSKTLKKTCKSYGIRDVRDLKKLMKSVKYGDVGFIADIDGLVDHKVCVHIPISVYMCFECRYTLCAPALSCRTSVHNLELMFPRSRGGSGMMI